MAAVGWLVVACGGELKLSESRLVQLQVTPQAASVAAGLSHQLRATAVYQDGHTQDISGQVSWASLDPGTASVDTGGLVTTAAAGSATIVATLLGESAVAEIQVSTATLVSLEVLPSLAVVPLGATVTAAVQGRLSDGSTVDLTAQVAWSTPLGGLAVETPGVARALAVGPARLCVSFRGIQALVDLAVTSATATQLRVTAARELAALPRGAEAPLVIRATFSDGTELDVSAEASVSVDGASVALVEGGAVRGLELGSAQLTVTFQGTSATLPVTVTAAELVGLALSPPEAIAPLGAFVQLTALGYYSDGSVADVTGLVTWGILDPLKIQLSSAADQAGHASGLVVGDQSVVTAEVPGTVLSATALVLVGAAASN
jgi:hypothetical protein